MDEERWVRVFEVTGAPGALDNTGASDAFEKRLNLVAGDPRVQRVRSEVKNSGTVRYDTIGEQPIITSYVIDVIYVGSSTIG